MSIGTALFASNADGIPIGFRVPRHLVSAVLQSVATPYGATILTPKMLSEALEATETTYFAWQAVKEAIEMRCVRQWVTFARARVDEVSYTSTGPTVNGTWTKFCQMQWTASCVQVIAMTRLPLTGLCSSFCWG